MTTHCIYVQTYKKKRLPSIVAEVFFLFQFKKMLVKPPDTLSVRYVAANCMIRCNVSFLACKGWKGLFSSLHTLDSDVACLNKVKFFCIGIHSLYVLYVKR